LSSCSFDRKSLNSVCKTIVPEVNFSATIILNLNTYSDKVINSHQRLQYRENGIQANQRQKRSALIGLLNQALWPYFGLMQTLPRVTDSSLVLIECYHVNIRTKNPLSIVTVIAPGQFQTINHSVTYYRDMPKAHEI